jgi:DNA polymerase III subunit alpha
MIYVQEYITMSPHFTPLHVHSYYSLLEGVDSLDTLLAHAAACGYQNLALTDSNNLYGAVKFIEATRKYGVRPILGACLRQELRGLMPPAQNPRCTALIAEEAGYRSLCRILSRLHLGAGSGDTRSTDENPRTPESFVDLLAENADGLHLLIDDQLCAGPDDARVMWLREAFGDRLWLEVVRPPKSAARERALLEAGQRLGLRPVASVAAHFATSDGYPTFRLLTAVRQGILLDQVPARLSITPAHHLPEIEEVYQRFRDLPEAIVNTDQLAEQCRSDVLPRGMVLPSPPVPHAHDAFSYLQLLCERGLRRRFHSLATDEHGSNTDSASVFHPCSSVAQSSDEKAIRERLDEELHIIRLRGLAGYFLIVRQIAREARRRRFSMALRGSAGNSLICYLLGITDIDPLRFNLPLERFLHAGRPDLPDIDLDFDWRERDEIIASVFERYGEAHTAMISSHLFLQPRSAFREAAKIHGLSNDQTSQLIETLVQRVEGFFDERGGGGEGERGRQDSKIEDRESRMEEDKPLQFSILDPQSSILEPQSRFASSSPPLTPSPLRPLSLPPPGFPLEPERWPRLLADARRLLGKPRHLSVHPGGIVITPGPIENYVPLQRAAKGVVITQFEKDAVEQIGLVKIDLLGNRALSTVSEALRRLDPVSRDIVSHAPDRDDETTLKLLQTGDTLGVNQLESPAMRHLLIQMRPRNMHDVIQALALIRPGAASIGAKEKFIRRRRGLEPVQHLHPSLEPLLNDSCGLMLYEDDALRVVQTLTGLSAPESDHFRKQITKSASNEETQSLSKAFLAACARNGIDRASAEETWINLAKFNSYSFCRSHSVSYGMIAWRAAYLKTHYPLIFWTAALNNNQGMYPRRVYVEAAKRAGIPFFLPCVNRSESEFSIEGVSGGVVSGSRIRKNAGNSLGTRVLANAATVYHHSPLTRLKGIRTGLSCIRSLDEKSRDAILEDRQRRGPYLSLPDFLSRVPIGSETLALLIQVGAFDFTSQSRSALMLEAALEERMPHSPSFFPPLSPGGSALGHRAGGEGEKKCENCSYDWTPTDYSQVRQWREEWEHLGFLPGPPLMVLFRPLLPKDSQDSRLVTANYVGRSIRLAGLVATGRHTETKNGEEMQFITLEDEWGLVDVTLFPRLCPPVPHLGVGPYIVEGDVDEQHGVLTVTARRFHRAIKQEKQHHSLTT